MTTSLSQLKAKRAGLQSKLATEIKKTSDNKAAAYPEDDRFWKPTTDKAGNGGAVLRFLPTNDGEDVPWVRYWDHGFKGPGGWYIEKSLTSIGLNDPVSEFNSTLWNSGLDSDKELARNQKRRLHYIANVLVVKDPGNPENEGKVKLFKFGKKIFDKLNAVMHPEDDDDEQPCNPFDMWEGRNFKLSVKKVAGFPNYDDSKFLSVGAIAGSDPEIEKVWNQTFSLQEFIDPSQYKSYDELKNRLSKVLGIEPEPSVDDIISQLEPRRAAAPALREVEADEEASDMSYFKSLVDDDDDDD